MLLWFVAGIVLGWLIEFYIDWRFWRRTTLSSESTHGVDGHELAALRQKIKEYEARIEELESLSSASTATITADKASQAVGTLSTQDQPTEAE
ncbi:MAG: hypothetical protein U0175_37850 [Caldilineaceae bacterium]